MRSTRCLSKARQTKNTDEKRNEITAKQCLNKTNNTLIMQERALKSAEETSKTT